MPDSLRDLSLSHIWFSALRQLQLQMCKLNPHFHACLMLSITTKWYCFAYWGPLPQEIYNPPYEPHKSPGVLPQVKTCVEGPDGIYSRHWQQMNLSQMELQAWAQWILPCEDQLEPFTRHLKNLKKLQCKCSWSCALGKRTVCWRLDMHLIKLFSLGFLPVVQALRVARVWVSCFCLDLARFGLLWIRNNREHSGVWI